MLRNFCPRLAELGLRLQVAYAETAPMIHHKDRTTLRLRGLWAVDADCDARSITHGDLAIFFVDGWVLLARLWLGGEIGFYSQHIHVGREGRELWVFFLLEYLDGGQ